MKKPTVLLTIPVYNEEKILEQTIKTLTTYIKENKFPFQCKIEIADNASTDATQEIGKKLQNKYNNVSYHRIKRKGRGFALKEVWSKSKEDIVSYMDVDLATDLSAYKPLIESISSRKYVLATGNRLGRKSKVIGRSLFREILSRGYNLILQAIFFSNIKDSQCGFKAIRKDAFMELVKETKDNNWFFDTEMLLLAKHKGMRLKQIDVKWTDDPDSRVKVVKTVREDLEGVARIKKYLRGKKKHKTWKPKK